MAKHDQTSILCFAAFNASAIVAPSLAPDIVLSEMATPIRYYSYFSFESLTTGNYTNDRFLILSIIANEKILYLWKPPGNTIISGNKKAGGNANF